MNKDYFPTLRDLILVEKYPDQDLCLDILWARTKPDICPRCKRNSRFYYITGRRSYTCGVCKLHISPAANTIFHKSKTPLPVWFKAIKLVYISNGAVPTTEITRQLSVTQKTAWRMKHRICEYLYVEKTYSYEYSSATKPVPPRRGNSKL